MLNSIAFTGDSPNSTRGSLRAKLRHPKPFTSSMLPLEMRIVGLGPTEVYVTKFIQLY